MKISRSTASYIFIGLLVAGLIAIVFCSFTTHPSGIVQEKKHRCSGINSYFWLVVSDATYAVNYDVWTKNEVNKPYIGP